MKQIVTLILSLFFSTLVYSQSVPSYVPTNGLVGWWGFNGNAQDASGNGNHGTINNGVTFTSDRNQGSNAAFQVLLNWQYCSSPNGFGITLPINLLNTEYSISVWCQSFDSLAHNQTIFNSSPHNFFGVGYNHGVTNPRNTIISFFGNNNGWILTNNNITWTSSLLQNWKHIVLVKSLGEIKFFENGQMVFSHLLPPISNPLGIDSIRFGAVTVNSVTIQSGCYEPFLGKIDDAGIWNRTLTQQEITNLYNAQLSTQTSLCLPTLTTNSPVSIGIDSVIVGGNILNDGGSSIVLRGVCYSTTPNPNMGNMRTEDGSGVGSFTSILRNLSPTMTYYARSYAKNSNGVVVYGNEVTFTALTLLGQPCPGTPTVTDIDGNVYNTVQIGNQCWMQSNLKVTKYRNGDAIPTGYTNNDWGTTISGAYAIYNNDTSVISLYGLHYNGFAVNDPRGICPTGWHVPTDNEFNLLVNTLGGDSVAGGAMKGVNLGFSAPNTGATNTSGFSAVAAGYFGPMGGNTDLWVNGYFWSANSGNWVRRVYYLDSAVHRHSYGSTWGFSVRCLRDSSVGGGGSASLPSVTTVAISGVTSTGASTGGNVTQDGGSPVTSRGVAYGLTSNPTASGTITTDGSGVGTFVSTLTGLTASTTYYVRAYATNGVGTAYGNEISFSTNTSNGFSSCGGVSDVDGNSYQTVQIGTQCWTQSNLTVSKYRNGDIIPNLSDNTLWSQTNTSSTGAWCNYNNDANNGTTYGKLYNWYAVNDTRGLCPTGWHVPTDSEWNLMVKYLDPNADTTCVGCLPYTNAAGTVLKSSSGWASNGNGTNLSGFTALPGGGRFNDGDFGNFGSNIYVFWWSSSVTGLGNAWCRYLNYYDAYIDRLNYDHRRGFYIRCVRD